MRDIKPRRARFGLGTSDPASLPAVAEPESEAASATPTPAAKPEPARRPSVPRPDKTPSPRNKKSAVLAAWQDGQAGKNIEKYFAGQLDEAARKFGHRSVMMAAETEAMVVGIPLPSLALEFLFVQSCMPLGFVYQLVGRWGSLKSALLYEFIRIFCEANGGGVLNENESKLSPYLCKSIVTPGYYRRLAHNRCESLEDWEERTLFWVDKIKKLLDGTKTEPGPGRRFPFIFGVDSVMGKLSRETAEKLYETGSASRNFAIEANYIAQYMRSVPQLFTEWPFVLMLVNHLKDKQDDAGNVVRHKPGGKAIDFQIAYEFETKKIKDIASSQWDGVRIEIACKKNSLGATGRKIHARMLWWEKDIGDGDFEQETVWDWGWSTVHLLATIGGRYKQRLADCGFHLAVPKTSDVECVGWSKNLGMTEDDAVSWSELGERIHADEALMATLRTALGVHRRATLTGDFREQIAEQAKVIRAKYAAERDAGSVPVKVPDGAQKVKREEGAAPKRRGKK